ncbi:MAG: hypothetical protein MUE60_16560 [Candidatus Eisenbacteria bacterium]|jgi:hypothetical protein|nr:hypothetical protein [Candidatus Eisenbacteria bacterium]
MLWLKLWAHDHNWPRTDVCWFGHVHYFTDSAQAVGRAITSPSLQLWTKFGARRCSGTVDWGAAQAIVSEAGVITVDKHLVDFVGGSPEEVVI